MELRILLVEDNTHIRESVDILLQAEGREVVSCESAEEALTAFSRQRFDVLVTDISLPEMSGIDLARRVLETHPAGGRERHVRPCHRSCASRGKLPRG